MGYPYQIRTIEQYTEHYHHSISDPEEFWNSVAENFIWKKKWDTTLEWNFLEPRVRWFEGGKLNITENALDRHAESTPDRVAIIWESNNPEEASVKISYRELQERVMKFCHVLKNNGIRKGDRICIYMPMIPELAVAVLACARVGAVHSVVFGGFSSKSIADRIEDAGCKMVITADGTQRGAKLLNLKQPVDEALENCGGVEKCIVVKRLGNEVTMTGGRDVWWHDELVKVENSGDSYFPAESMDSEDMLFILYTSGSTGKPKGVVHTCGGYMVWVTYTFVNVFQYQPGQVHFCTADLGWITGHSYILYGPLCAGATTLMFEGVPNWPNPDRIWKISKKHGANIIYTAPTAIRALMCSGDEWVNNVNLPSVQVLGSVGEPINEEAWHWFFTKIGHGKAPLVDTWWQTETGGIMIAPLAGITKTIPSWATLPLPGVVPVLLNENGSELQGAAQGFLCFKFPWPGMLRTTYGDHERCRLTYFDRFKGYYFTGDGASRDSSGNYRITGRVDDVLNVSGHRIGTAEVENAINLYREVGESAVVGFSHPIKGQGIYAFVMPISGEFDENLIREGVTKSVRTVIGPVATPDKIQIVTGLPKTRSGKIMRRILRKIADGDIENLGDTSTLLDPNVVTDIISGKL